ncbi:hypothetical protein STRDD10_00908 [Streptococcus sp. DD10]|nr:hypothetical protein STRDD10_00908 [Streptococcus sp. DD10]
MKKKHMLHTGEYTTYKEFGLELKFLGFKANGDYFYRSVNK